MSLSETKSNKQEIKNDSDVNKMIEKYTEIFKKYTSTEEKLSKQIMNNNKKLDSGERRLRNLEYR